VTTGPLDEVSSRVEAIRAWANWALLGELDHEATLEQISKLATVIQLRIKAMSRGD
jgi:hypothetical protein